MIRPTIRPSNVDIWSVNNKDSDEPHGDSDLAFGDSDLDSDLPVGDSDLDSVLPVGDSTTTLGGEPTHPAVHARIVTHEVPGVLSCAFILVVFLLC